MPKMNEMLFKIESFHCTTSLDLNKGCYHIQMNKSSSNLCTIILLWGKYQYKRLTMGVANLPDIFQQKINDLFHGFEFKIAYIDNILI